MSGSIPRRGFIAGSAAAVAAIAGARLISPAQASDVVSFDGKHQAGIVTPAQDRMHFAAFDVVAGTTREQLRNLLKTWTAMARRMSLGLEAVEDGATGKGPFAVPSDTGEALGLSPAHLTITIGFGPSLFDDRFGLASQRPSMLYDLPHFSGDVIDPARSFGDIAIQACADDPQVAVHAIRDLAKAGVGIVTVRWSQMGFGRTSSTSRAQLTPRNLFGFKDGTNNLKAEDESLLDEHLWVSGTGTWLDGGTYLITRRIRMLIENWDRQVLSDQEETFGRYKRSGAPLGRENEFDPLPLDEYRNADGPVIPADAHARLASPAENNGAQMLRRGYNFVDNSDGFGHLDAGLFFIAFVNNPEENFIPIQSRLSKKDKLNEYIRYESSAIFACPSGLADDNDYWGRKLFEAVDN